MAVRKAFIASRLRWHKMSWFPSCEPKVKKFCVRHQIKFHLHSMWHMVVYWLACYTPNKEVWVWAQCSFILLIIKSEMIKWWLYKTLQRNFKSVFLMILFQFFLRKFFFQNLSFKTQWYAGTVFHSFLLGVGQNIATTDLLPYTFHSKATLW